MIHLKRHYETYSALESNAMYFNGGGFIGYHVFNVVSKLVSVFGYGLITLLILVSSMILIFNKKHRDITKSLFENVQSKTKSKMVNLERKREEKSQIKKQEKEKRKQEKIKDVSDMKEIKMDNPPETKNQETSYDDIPIFESTEKQQLKKNQFLNQKLNKKNQLRKQMNLL